MEKKTKSKIRIIAITLSTIAFVALLYSYMCFVFLPKDITDQGGENYYRGKGFMAEPLPNSLDVIAFGHSGVYSGFSPVELFKKYGYTSYAAGVALQSINKINEQLEQGINIQKPKFAFLDVDCLYMSPLKDSALINLGAPFIYHARWKSLKPRDFYQAPGKINAPDLNKGYIISKKVYNVKNTDYMGSVSQQPQAPSKKNLRQLRRFIKICEEHGIKVVFINFPNATTWNYARHNYIKDFAQSKNIEFLDMNIPQSNFTVDFSHDFRDNGNHLNIYGAQKATDFLGAYLSANFGDILSDKRGNPQFDYWKQSVTLYDNQL